ncbi:MAG: MFS transporter [Streptosporangiaceae bacterium]
MESRRRDGVWLLAGSSAASNTGNWAATVALSLTVFAKTGSTVWLSASFLFTQVPSALVAPLSGMMADRLNRKIIMITCDLLGAGVYAGMAVTGRPLPLILYAATGAGPAFAVNAASFVTSAALAALVRGPFRSDSAAAGAASAGSVWAGARFLWHNSMLLTLTVIGAVTFMATEIAAVADLPLIHDFGVGGVGYGILNVAWGAGGLIGALIAARVVTKNSETAAAVIGVLVFGIFVAAVGAAPWFAAIPVFSLLFAGSDSFAFVGFSGIYQRSTPDAIRGRTFAAVGAITTFATAVSFGFAGFLVEAAGWRPVYLGGGLIDVACAAVLALTLRRRSSLPAIHPPPPGPV